MSLFLAIAQVSKAGTCWLVHTKAGNGLGFSVTKFHGGEVIPKLVQSVAQFP